MKEYVPKSKHDIYISDESQGDSKLVMDVEILSKQVSRGV